MTELEQFTEMLSRAKIKFKVKQHDDQKTVVRIFGRFSCDQTLFKFDESGNLYFAGGFDEPAIQ